MAPADVGLVGAALASASASRRCSSASYSRAFNCFIASARFLCWLRWFWHWTTMLVGTWVMRTALSVVLMCCPPAPDAR